MQVNDDDLFDEGITLIAVRHGICGSLELGYLSVVVIVSVTVLCILMLRIHPHDQYRVP